MCAKALWQKSATEVPPSSEKLKHLVVTFMMVLVTFHCNYDMVNLITEQTIPFPPPRLGILLQAACESRKKHHFLIK